MPLTLTQEQQAWVNAQIARGEFPSTEAAVRQLLDERIAERMEEAADDLAWAKPAVDAALSAAANGDLITHAEHTARNAARLAALKLKG